MSEPAPSEHPDQSAARPKVLYVLGAGRSGSTILGVTLGNCDGVFYAGELDKWLPRRGRTPLPGAARESFWERVLERVDAADLFGSATRCLERSSALLTPRCWRARRRLRGRYREVAEQLYRSVAQAAGAEYVVDTSHYPLRAAEVQRLAGVDVYLIFAVREPHSVVQSFGREDVLERRFGPLTTNVYLWLTYLFSMFVFLRHPRERRLFLRHEDFLADPRAALQAILDAVSSPAPLPDLGALDTGLAFQGNRLVRNDVVALRGAGERRPRALLITSVLQLPLRMMLARMRPVVEISDA
jgi:sulfotransferase family protein